MCIEPETEAEAESCEDSWASTVRSPEGNAASQIGALRTPSLGTLGNALSSVISKPFLYFGPLRSPHFAKEEAEICLRREISSKVKPGQADAFLPTVWR